ncbi:DUF3572 domain-containing protein [Seohaeicola saemankumensis]|jgi:hypothetical protein|uniref:DUF3572 domain-containing protein n=1 Tax=Seohaeicola TaxID=481178 RepID=UPI0007F44E9E|nr:DUF3572 domain-containing protein [Paracoccaceae bacterium]MDP5365279.1 DUF3572 domain-containing protein [Paracoccaceae bacterium]OAN71247.1 hypothetical protein A8B83_12400 [Rhodobacteraceae bacterium EhC02]
MKSEQEKAEMLAIEALGWMAGNDEVLGQFMAASGASIDDLRAGAADPAFLGALLDFLMLEDAWVIAFCDAARQPYDAPMRARAALPGGAQMHWT